VSKKSIVTVVWVVILAGVFIGYWYVFMPSRLSTEAMREALMASERLEKAPQPDNVEQEETKTPPKVGPNDEVRYFRYLPEPPTDGAGGIPEKFLVRYHCSNGDFVAAFYKSWAPHGVQRLYDLIKEKSHDEARFFRVLPSFAVQWGIPAKPSQIAKWREATIPDDPPNNQPNTRGKIAFAQSGPNTRTMQLFVNLVDNSKNLDGQGFVPIGEVLYGMKTLDTLNAEYAEQPTDKLKEILAMGNLFLEQEFPNLDFIIKAWFVEETNADDPQAQPVVFAKEMAIEGVSGQMVDLNNVSDANTQVVYLKQLAEAPKESDGAPPSIFTVLFKTSKGDFVASFAKRWAPRGHERIYQLVRDKVYDGAKFFRVVPGFVVQFGIPADPSIGVDYREAPLKDDPVIESNKRGTISFAAAGPNTRTIQVFINYRDNSRLDGMGFAPVGKVEYGMEVVDALNAQYGEQPARFQRDIMERGNAFLDERFPGLDYIREAVFVQPSTPRDPEAKPFVFRSSAVLSSVSQTEKDAEEAAKGNTSSTQAQNENESSSGESPGSQP